MTRTNVVPTLDPTSDPRVIYSRVGLRGNPGVFLVPRWHATK